jgi:hypothetical protein
MLRKLITAGVIVALLVGAAAAQQPQQPLQPSIPLNQKRPPTQEEIDRQKAADDAYDAAIKKIPEKKSSADPWGTIRPSSPTASKSKQQ